MYKISTRYFSFVTKCIRNVGIIAHIDAGKTTTTERILFNTGKINYVGEVDKGTTITDYMDQERKRGITIMSSTANVRWLDHSINLIDTPGHVDFTLEVERSLTVLDSAVTILDSTRGVEAQTQTVWNQAVDHKIANIFYLNKFDRPKSNLDLCLSHITKKLSHTKPILIQIPTYHKESGQFNGIIDVIDLTYEEWDLNSKTDDNIYSESTVRKLKDSEEYFAKTLECRLNIIQILADLDDGILRDEFLILNKPELLIPATMIHDTLRKTTISTLVSPVVIGSSKVNMGVTSLLDKIVKYLPNPTEKQLPEHFQLLAKNPDHLSALAFKIIHDEFRGPLTFLRLYSGILKPNMKLKNINKSLFEKVDGIFQITGDMFTNLTDCYSGNIVVVSGLKDSVTGDFLVDSQMPSFVEDISDTHTHKEFLNKLITVPEPVIHASLEAYTLTEMKDLENALKQLCKEDPSLTYYIDENSHQLILGGMGSLHLEVTLERIKQEYKLSKTRMGKIRIVYKECPLVSNFQGLTETYELKHKQKYSETHVSISMSMDLSKDLYEKCEIKFVNSREFNWKAVFDQYNRMLHNTLMKSLHHAGPLLRTQLTGISVSVHSLLINNKPENINKALLPIVQSAMVGCLKSLISRIETVLIEPMMFAEISFSHSDSALNIYKSNITNDLHRRRAIILAKETDLPNQSGVVDTIKAYIPLAEALDYSDAIRNLSSGHANLYFKFSHYDQMDAKSQEKVMKKRMYRG